MLKEENTRYFLRGLEDFIVHELTHARQAQLLREHGWEMKRGAHRDLGWYTAVAEACPRYLGVEMPRSAPGQSARVAAKTRVRSPRSRSPIGRGRCAGSLRPMTRACPKSRPRHIN
jgi:hypothetical protein